MTQSRMNKININLKVGQSLLQNKHKLKSRAKLIVEKGHMQLKEELNAWKFKSAKQKM